MRRMAMVLVVAGLWAAGLTVAERQARAGSCPTCAQPSDCPGGFCVLHNADVGCGSLRMLCCPGQACNTFSGRPSCEAAGTCTVVGGAVDAAVRDSAVARDGAAGGDAQAGQDAGGKPGGEDSGCTCHTTGPRGRRAPVPLALGLGAALGLAVLRARRRPR